MVKKPRIALAQIRYFDIHKKHNLDKIIHFIKEASKVKADIVCFPESSILSDSYLTFSHTILKEIKQACKKNNIWCIINEVFIHNKEKYNIAILIDRKGKIRGRYKKKNPIGERGVVPGTKVNVYSTDFGKIGIAICWDLAFPEIFKKMKDSGAKLVLCPSQWSYEKSVYQENHKQNELKLLKSLILSRAFENLIYLGFCSPITDEKELVSYSAIASPHEILKEIKFKEGLIYSDISYSSLTKFKKLYPGK